MSAEGAQPGVRLAKRVAALQGCSRSQAEALIAAGAVQVDGQVVTDPARRVTEHLTVQLCAGPAIGAVTVLLHKPAGISAAQALHQAWSALSLGPVPPPGLKQWLPLPDKASGLSIWSDEQPVVRRLLERQRPLELEWLLSMPIDAADGVIAALQEGGMRTSLGHARDGIGQWRLVDKGDRGQTLAELLDQGQLHGVSTLRRQRVGRLSVAPLSPGQARQRLDFEKF